MSRYFWRARRKDIPCNVVFYRLLFSKIEIIAFGFLSIKRLPMKPSKAWTNAIRLIASKTDFLLFVYINVKPIYTGRQILTVSSLFLELIKFVLMSNFHLFFHSSLSTIVGNHRRQEIAGFWGERNKIRLILFAFIQCIQNVSNLEKIIKYIAWYWLSNRKWDDPTRKVTFVQLCYGTQLV